MFRTWGNDEQDLSARAWLAGFGVKCVTDAPRPAISGAHSSRTRCTSSSSSTTSSSSSGAFFRRLDRPAARASLRPDSGTRPAMARRGRRSRVACGRPARTPDRRPRLLRGLRAGARVGVAPRKIQSGPTGGRRARTTAGPPRVERRWRTRSRWSRASVSPVLSASCRWASAVVLSGSILACRHGDQASHAPATLCWLNGLPSSQRSAEHLAIFARTSPAIVKLGSDEVASPQAL